MGEAKSGEKNTQADKFPYGMISDSIEMVKNAMTAKRKVFTYDFGYHE